MNGRRATDPSIPVQSRRILPPSSLPPSSPAAPPAGVDPKLFQIVRRIVSSAPSPPVGDPHGGGGDGGRNARPALRGNGAAAASTTSLVLERHREYRRKDPGAVRSGVESALAALAAQAAVTVRSSTSGGGGRRSISPPVPFGGGSGGSASSCAAPSCDRSQKRKRGDIGNGGIWSGEVETPPAGTYGGTNESGAAVDGIRARKASYGVSVRCSGEGGSGRDDDRQCYGGGGESEASVGGEGVKMTVPVSAGDDVRTKTGGMLNAGLRDRYKVQAERESAAASKAAKTVTEGEREAASDGTSIPPPTVAKPGVAKVASAAAPATPASRKRKKKSSSSRRPSRSDFPPPSGGEEGGDGASADFISPAPRPSERYSDLGGIGTLLRQIRELVEYPLSHPEVFAHLGVDPPRGVLLRGPPGCGKTHLADAVAGELGVAYYRVSAPEIVGGVSGESESRIRSLFECAARTAPSIVFVDEIDAIAPKRSEGSGGGGRAMEKRIVAQLLTSLDGLSPKNTRDGRPVMVLGATNRPDAIDPALRRAGRFDREIVLGAPDEKARESILRVMTRTMRVDGSFNHAALARKTPGFVGADVRSLTKEAAVSAINRIFRSSLLGPLGSELSSSVVEAASTEDIVMATLDEAAGPAAKTEIDAGSGAEEESTAEMQPSSAANDVLSVVPLSSAQLEPLYVTMNDFLHAIPRVQPSSKREGFTTSPDVSWSDVGALAQIREELTLSVLEPIAHPEKFRALGLPLPAGVLLYGPPGCGKTLLAKAIANESGANFISVKGPELLDKYVGESERSVRVVFERARSSSPCIIFFDELDSLCPRRGSDGGGGGGVSERVVNQLLTEMDGLDSRRSVFVIAATNRPELIDSAMLRPGRLDKLLYVPLPTRDDRFSILRALGKNVKLASNVDLRAIANDSKADGFSGADCAALLREAGLAVLRDSVLNEQSKSISGTDPTTAVTDDAVSGDNRFEVPLQITTHHFKYAFDHVMPSVSKRDQVRYDRIRDKMARARTRGGELSDKKGDEVNEVKSIPASPQSS